MILPDLEDVLLIIASVRAEKYDYFARQLISEALPSVRQFRCGMHYRGGQEAVACCD